jgi:pantetheine-phosphate adenylyltransferase
MRRRVAVMPATFDPPTNGHLEIITRASSLFDELVVAVYRSPNKQLLFDVDERVELVRAAVIEAGLHNVRARSYDGLTVNVAREEGAIALIRGLRGVADFDIEFQMSHMNKQLAPGVETVAILASADFMFLSSTLVREVAKLGGDVRRWVPHVVAQRLEERFAPGSIGTGSGTVPDAEGGADRMAGFVVQDERVR